MDGLPDDRLAGFTIGDGPVGVLTCHGFTGTPYEMRELAVGLADHGYRVTNVKLAGHAETEDALARTRWPDWWRSLVDAYHALAAECETVYMCGMSMGGVLGLHLAAHYPIAKAAIFAAPLFLDDPKLKFVPVAKYFRAIQPKGDSDIRDAEARAVHPHCGGTPLRCVESLMELLRHVNEDLPDVRCPLLLIYGSGDGTVPYRNLAHVAARVSSEQVQTITLHETGHVMTVDCEKTRVQDEALAFFNGVANAGASAR